MPQPAPPDRIYKIFRPAEWDALQAHGVFAGSADDQRDGFIHFSTADQLAGTLSRHFADAAEVVVAAVAAGPLGETLRWEPSRGGALFPHLYAALPLAAITAHRVVRRGGDGALTAPADL
jgi:uncharacterized protein (DUF952 family)